MTVEEVNNLRGTGRRRGWLICLRLACLRLAVLAVLAVRRRDDVHGTFLPTTHTSQSHRLVTPWRRPVWLRGAVCTLRQAVCGD